MKKILLFVALVLPLILSAQTGLDFRTDWEKDGLKGKVKQTSTYIHINPRIKTYNTLGYIVEIEYDFHYAKVKRTYQKDKIISSESFDENGTSETITNYEYNGKGQLVSYTTKSEYGTTIGKYEYNSDKTLKTFMRFDNDSSKYSYLVELTYKKGILVEENQFGPNRAPYIWAIYNTNKQCTEYKKWRSDGALRIHGRYLYDDNGFLKEWDSEKDGVWNVYYKYENDKYGNTISATSDDGRVRTYKYEYDSHGNWIKKEEYSDGTLYNTETRVIEYY